MQLHLSVISKDRYYLGDNAQHTFDIAGGTIGRDSACTWFIEDSSRYLSSLHLTITFHNGAFYITDQSTNGTYRDHKRLQPGVQDPRPLAVGDELHLGQIRLQVIGLGDTNSCSPDLDSDSELRASITQVRNNQQDMLAHQARLADVIAQSYPELDHGEALQITQEQTPVFKQVFAKEPGVDEPNAMQSRQPQIPASALPLTSVNEPPHWMQHTLVVSLLLALQQQLARDRIANPAHFDSLSLDNVFRTASSFDDVLVMHGGEKAFKKDVDEALAYLLAAVNEI